MISSKEKEPMYVSSEVDLIISVMVSVAGLAINSKLLKDMKEDFRMRPPGTNPSLIQDVMTTYTKTLMIFCPSYLFLFWILNEEIYLPDWLKYLLCYDQYIATTVRFYFYFHSMIVAIMRYSFIVHHERIMVFGKDEAKAMFYHISVIIPIIFGVTHACTLPIPKNAQNLAQRTCNNFYKDNYNITCGDPSGIPDECSPILVFVKEYISPELLSYVGLVVKIVFVVVYSNIFEGILYLKTFRTIKR